MNVIFLDVDGVLNCISTKDRIKRFKGIDNDKVALLKEMADFLEADIVLSSSWRYEVAMRGKLEERLGEYGLTLTDSTPDISWRRRGGEILKWLNGRDVEYFVILDDEEFDYLISGLKSHWIPTSYFSRNGGLLREHVEYLKNNKEQFRKKQP